MVAQYNKGLADEQRKVDEIERWDQAVFKPNRLPTPSYFEHESLDQQRKRLMNRTRPLVSAALQEIRTDDVFGTALDHVAQQYFESAAQEAARPSKVPEGELKQITRYDQSGRPFYENFGSPSAWMSMFMGDKKRLISIKDNRQWQKIY
jgi:hypothetical protein